MRRYLAVSGLLLSSSARLLAGPVPEAPPLNLAPPAAEAPTNLIQPPPKPTLPVAVPSPSALLHPKKGDSLLRPRPALTPAGTDAELTALQHEAIRLRTEREALAAECAKPGAAAPESATTETGAEAARLRARLAELIAKLEAKKREHARPVEATPAPVHPIAAAKLEVPVPPAPAPVVVRPEAALKRAQGQFRASQFDTALATCRGIDTSTLNNEDRALVSYLSASCLRSLGQLDEATVLYRTVIEAHGDKDLVESANWQLTSIEARRNILRELAEIHDNRSTR